MSEQKVIEPSRLRAKKTVQKKYGKDYYRNIGKAGIEKRWKQYKLDRIQEQEARKEVTNG